MEIFSQQIQKILKTFKHNLLNENCFSCFFPLKSLSIFVCQCICLVCIAKNGKITLEHLFMLNEAALHVHKKKFNRFSHQHWGSGGIFIALYAAEILFCGFLCYCICYENFVNINATLPDFH